MEQEARKIAEDLAERCARWSRGNPDLAVALGYEVVAKFLATLAADYAVCASKDDFSQAE